MNLTSEEFTKVLEKLDAIVSKYNIDKVEFGCSREHDLYVASWQYQDKILLVGATNSLPYYMENNKGLLLAKGFLQSDYDFLDLYRRLFQ